MLPRIGAKTEALLRDLLPSFNPIIEEGYPLPHQGESIATINLPAASGAEYSFTLWFCEDGERQISAKLNQYQNDGPYFWYRPFELAEFRHDVEKLEAEFCHELEILLTHETRIVQTKGWLFWSFLCECYKGEKWKKVYGHKALRWFRPPQIMGKSRIYSAARASSAFQRPTM